MLKFNIRPSVMVAVLKFNIRTSVMVAVCLLSLGLRVITCQNRSSFNCSLSFSVDLKYDLPEELCYLDISVHPIEEIICTGQTLVC